ncbi:MAG: amino acid ABC transporter substrate-binding protein [Deltaproteobacteria bacterium]|nr:amino acid ABC transporter substrate-binding protein [Deltaproteobacteria bacterium]
MKKSVLIISLLLFNIFPVSFINAESITVGYFLLEPHSSQKDGKHVGAIIDYWRNYIAPKMRVDVKFVGPYPVPRLIKETTNGRVNVIALLAKNDERSNMMDYPNNPFVTGSTGIAFLKNHRIKKIESVKELNGLTLGFFAKGFIHPLLKNKMIKWHLTYTTKWQKRNLKMLNYERIDGLYNADINALVYNAHINNMKEKVNIFPIPGTETGLYSLFSKKDKGRYLKNYNQIHPQVLEEVSYLDLVEKYMK